MNDFIYVPVSCEIKPQEEGVYFIWDWQDDEYFIVFYQDNDFFDGGRAIGPRNWKSYKWLKKVPVSEYMSDTGKIKEQLLLIMRENLRAVRYGKKMGWRDTLKSSNAFDCVIETYEDLIAIITNLPCWCW